MPKLRWYPSPWFVSFGFFFFYFFKDNDGYFSLSDLFRLKAVRVQELQSLGWWEIGALSIPPAELMVTGPERKKLEKKSRRLCSLGLGAVGWFGLMWVLVCTLGVFFCFSPAMFFFPYSCLWLIIRQWLIIKSSVYPGLCSWFHIIYKSNSFT